MNPIRFTRRGAELAERRRPATAEIDRDRFENSSVEFATDFSNRTIWLVRGEDCAGRSNFMVGHAPAG